MVRVKVAAEVKLEGNCTSVFSSFVLLSQLRLAEPEVAVQFMVAPAGIT